MRNALANGFRSRMASMEDLEAIQVLIDRTSLHYSGSPGLSLDRLRNRFSMPGFEISQSVHLVEDLSGKLVALGEVADFIEPAVYPAAWVTVDPQYESRGLEEFLLEWAEDRARQVLERVAPDVQVALRVYVNHVIEPIRQALIGAGYAETRHSYRMRVEMDGPPPEAVWPEGIHLRPFDLQSDARLVYETDEEVFQDHFGFVEQDPDDGFEKYMHHMAGYESFDPDLWFLAADGDELVAICLCRRFSPESREAGYISSLGVKRGWRRQGIAQALLRHTFGEFYRRGVFKVDLGVDAESLTGATELYRKVGMRVIKQFDMYQKVLRPGRDISVTSLPPEEAGDQLNER